jgi:hypothetical protein
VKSGGFSVVIASQADSGGTFGQQSESSRRHMNWQKT